MVGQLMADMAKSAGGGQFASGAQSGRGDVGNTGTMTTGGIYFAPKGIDQKYIIGGLILAGVLWMIARKGK